MSAQQSYRYVSIILIMVFILQPLSLGSSPTQPIYAYGNERMDSVAENLTANWIEEATASTIVHPQLNVDTENVLLDPTPLQSAQMPLLDLEEPPPPIPPTPLEPDRLDLGMAESNDQLAHKENNVQPFAVREFGIMLSSSEPDSYGYTFADSA